MALFTILNMIYFNIICFAIILILNHKLHKQTVALKKENVVLLAKLKYKSILLSAQENLINDLERKYQRPKTISNTKPHG